jgi:hypothetical protein
MEEVVLEAFENKHIVPWQEAIDRMDISPCPLGGPEYASSMEAAWQKTYIYRNGELFMPLFKCPTKLFRYIPSFHYQGVQTNSMIGLRKITSDSFNLLADLPKDCIITLDLPADAYQKFEPELTKLGYDLIGAYDYHIVHLRGSYEEWFNRGIIERRSIRKAVQSGVVVKIGGRELLRTFYELYMHSARRWQSITPRSSFHRYDRVERLFTFPGGRIQIAIAYYGDLPVSGIIFGAYRRAAAYLFGGVNYEFQHLRSANLVHAIVIKELIAEGITEYSMGISLGNSKLERFKESMGAIRHHAVVVARHRYPRLRRLIGHLTYFKSVSSRESGGHEL